ncbi:MAG: ASCH domain-containing protein [bacterium]
MNTKQVKFKPHLADLILKGEKTTTWRLFDDKDLQVGDVSDLINSDTKEIFATAEIKQVKEKLFGSVEDTDLIGHEKFASDEEMYATYKMYYGDRVDENTIVKIITFKLK